MWIAGAMACAVASQANAQSVPASAAPQTNPALISDQNQQIREQIERQTALPQTPPVVSGPPSQFAVSAPGGPSFILRDVTVDDSRFISRDEINAIVKKYIGQRVDISAIQRMVKEINDLFGDRKITTAAAFLPPQKLKDGIVHVKIVEGRLGKLLVKGANALSPAFVLSHVDEKPGDIVDLPSLSNRLAMFNSTGFARIQAALQPGVAFGLTDIELSVTEPPRNQLQLFVDNQGVPAVGQNEVGALVQLYSPLMFDDRLTLYAVKSGGNVNGSVSYNVPLDPWGGRIGASYVDGAIKDISGPYQSLDVQGTSEVASINLSQPVFAHDAWLLQLNGAVSRNISNSTESGVPITANFATLETGGFRISYAGDSFSASVSPTLTDVQSRSAVSNGEANFLLQGGSFVSSLKLPADFNATFNGSWQASSVQLIPGDQLFQIGGPTTVRGYPANAVAAPDGFYSNLELHHALPFLNGALDAYAFYDEGAVYNHFPAIQDLNSLGLGVSWNVDKYAVADVFAGFPLNDVVNPQPSGILYFRLTLKLD